MEQVLINKTTLTAIGDAIREKEGSTELVPVNDMASRISAIAGASGKRFTTGTVTFTTANANVNIRTVTHNLGAIPSYFFMIVKDKNLNFTFNTENQAPAGIYGFSWSKYENLGNVFTGNITNTNYGRTIEWRNNNSAVLQWVANSQGTTPMATETEISVSYRNSAYKYLVDTEYEWIAIE